MSVTVKDIAKEAGVSPAAVSKALNNRGGISIMQKNKIQKIAENMGYFPYIKSRQSGMFTDNSKYIGIISVFVDEFLSSEINKGIDSNLKNTEYYKILLTLDDFALKKDEVRAERFLNTIIKNKPIAGLLTVFVKLADATVAGLHKKGIPVVQLNNYSSFGKCVYIDNAESSYEMTKSLIKLKRRKIGLIMPEETLENVWTERLEGYKRALAEAKIQYNPYLIVYEHQFTIRESAHAVKTLLEREPKTDAILFGSDTQAYGGLEALRQLNKTVPDDIAVAGFDDLPFSKLANPPLSSVSQPMFDMGAKGSSMLLNAMHNKDFSHKAVKLQSKLALRQSTHKNIPKEKYL